VWLALALLFSILFRSAATAALITLGMWLFLTILWPLLSPALADALTPPGDVLGILSMRQAFARISPSSLFNEVVALVLDPSVRSTQQSMLAAMGLVLLERGAIPEAPIPLLQSLLVVWPQIVGLIAGSILLFVAGYILFQRQEVRA
jgi:ABC-2 type transport system permease protein